MSVSEKIRRLCEEVRAWQKDEKVQCIPKSKTKEDRERKLGVRFAKVLVRRSKATGTEPYRAMLNDAERSMVDRIPGVVVRGLLKDGQCFRKDRRMTAGNRLPLASKCVVAARQSDTSSRCPSLEEIPELHGSVQNRSMGGWRVQVKIDENMCVGPVRRDKVEAEADLREAQEAARDAMKTCIQEIKSRVR
jgi:hypothetical protein